MSSGAGISPERIAVLLARENESFAAMRPRSMALLERAHRTMPRGVPMSWMDDLYEHPPVFVERGAGSRFVDVDGHGYLDMYIADMSAFCGQAPPAVVDAVSRQIAAGNQFLMPGEDAIVVAEHLAERYGFPKWQFTLSATQAITEIMRVARAITGREKILLFDGKYHGHGDQTLVVLEDDQVALEEVGLPARIAAEARIVSFNDGEAVARALEPGDVALVLTEPAMTNAGFILPEPGFHDALRRLTRETGTLLAIDETHTLVCGYGGLSEAWRLEADVYVIGKSIAAGVPLAAYGMQDEVAAAIGPPPEPNVVAGAFSAQIASGGTLFANALSMAAGRAALLDVLTPDAFARTAGLGARMADGLRASIARAGLPWSVVQVGAHACYFFAPHPPHDAAGSRAIDDPDLRALIRVWLANRGVWESGWWLGPTVSVAHTADDVDGYVELFGMCLDDLVFTTAG